MVTLSPDRYAGILRVRLQERDTLRGQLAQLIRRLNALESERREIEATRLTALQDQQRFRNRSLSITSLQTAAEHQRHLQQTAERLAASQQHVAQQLPPLQKALQQADQQVAAIEKLIEREKLRRAQQAIHEEYIAQDTAAMAKFYREHQRQQG